MEKELKAQLVDNFSKLMDKYKDPEAWLATLPPAVQRRIAALRELQDAHDAHEDAYQKEKATLEAKYRALYAPLISQRFDIVTGATDPAAGEGAGAAGGAEGGEADIVGVPDFWVTAMKNHHLLVEEISEKDEKVLAFVQDIACTPLAGEGGAGGDGPEGQEGFCLAFAFRPNPYFTNKVLTKKYIMKDEENDILEMAEGTEIAWKPNKNVTVKVMKKKSKGKRSSGPQTKIEKVPSFFDFFSPPDVSKLMDEDAAEELEDDELQELQELVEEDYDMGCTFKDTLIPHAVRWFTGEAYEDSDDDDEEAQLEEVEEEGEEDEEGESAGEAEAEELDPSDDEDDDGEEEALPDAPPEKPPECKQQ